MTDETAEKIVDFVKAHASHLSGFSVTWFGGEPLLDVNRIENLSAAFLEICKQNDIKYKADIVSNGYHYSAEIAKRLKDCDINNIQITLDGNKKTHDSKRFLQDNTGTFDTIIHNIENAKGILPIALRLNVDAENISETDEIIALIKEKNLEEFVFPYLGRLESYNDNVLENRCFSTKEFRSINLDFTKSMGRELSSFFPSPKSNYCMADARQGFLIDPLGDVYKCFVDVGIESRKIFSLTDENMKVLPILQDYMLFDPITDSMCSDCKFLPICMGGCPSQRRNSSADVCTDIKYNLSEYLFACAKEFLADL